MINAHVLLLLRFFITLALMTAIAVLMWASIIHPLDPVAQRLADMTMGALLGSLTGSCIAWFFSSNAGMAQAQATIADQGKMLLAATPPVTPPTT